MRGSPSEGTTDTPRISDRKTPKKGPSSNLRLQNPKGPKNPTRPDSEETLGSSFGVLGADMS